MRTADDVQVAVLLALHRVVAEVGEEPEAARAECLPQFDRPPPDAADILPEFGLGPVLLRHRQEHDRGPTEDVLDDDHVVVLVDDCRRLLPGHDVAEDAVRAHVATSMVRAAPFAHKPTQTEM